MADLKSFLESNPWDPIASVLKQRQKNKRSKALFNSLNLPNGELAIIGEIKRRSPSLGYIGSIHNPQQLAEVYHRGGCAAVSVLTDNENFGGTIGDLRSIVRQQQENRTEHPSPCPVLRKDFIIDEVQIAETAAGGADAVLLIVAALGAKRTKELMIAAHEMGLDAMVEVHDEYELEAASNAGADIIAVNNRSLRNLEVSMETSIRLRDMIDDNCVKVSESGIVKPVDAWRLRDLGYNAVVVGETLVKAHERSFGLVEWSEAIPFIKSYKSKNPVPESAIP